MLFVARGFLLLWNPQLDGSLLVPSQVYSAYKFALAARDRKQPIAIVNIGPTRADPFAALKLGSRCGELLPLIALK